MFYIAIITVWVIWIPAQVLTDTTPVSDPAIWMYLMFTRSMYVPVFCVLRI